MHAYGPLLGADYHWAARILRARELGLDADRVVAAAESVHTGPELLRGFARMDLDELRELVRENYAVGWHRQEDGRWPPAPDAHGNYPKGKGRHEADVGPGGPA